jgi:hypothetical protein
MLYTNTPSARPLFSRTKREKKRRKNSPCSQTGASTLATIVPPAADNPNPKPTNTKNPNTLASISPTSPAVLSSPHPNIINALAATNVSTNLTFPFPPFTAPAVIVPAADAASIGSSMSPASRAERP